MNRRAEELIKFASEKYGEEFADRFREIIPESRKELRDDVLTLKNSEFFTQYKSIVETSISNSKKYNSLKQSTEHRSEVPCYTWKFEELQNGKIPSRTGIIIFEDHLTAKYGSQLKKLISISGRLTKK